MDEGRTAGLGEDDVGDGSFIFGGELELPLPLPLSLSLSLRPTKRLNSFGDSLRTTMALGAPDRLERPLVAELAEAGVGIFRLKVGVVNLGINIWQAEAVKE